MVIDIELTLNRFGFGRISANKFQFLCLRFSKWPVKGKYSISFEINWRTKEGVESHESSDDTPTFSDPDFAAEAGEKGRQVVDARIERRKARIMAKAVAEGSITNDGVEELFCISDATARNYLHELTAEGKLTRVGETGRSVRYEPAH
ncbi:MAG: hypothetical protein WC030_03275 [Candidatus Paceibacterota bacterium]